MNDLLVPILIMMGDEVDAFWCFKGLMDRCVRDFPFDVHERARARVCVVDTISEHSQRDLCSQMGNFHKDQVAMTSQLTSIAHILKYLDPILHRSLEETDSLNMFFCFRWVLLQFKREFSPQDICKVRNNAPRMFLVVNHGRCGTRSGHAQRRTTSTSSSLWPSFSRCVTKSSANA